MPSASFPRSQKSYQTRQKGRKSFHFSREKIWYQFHSLDFFRAVRDSNIVLEYRQRTKRTKTAQKKVIKFLYSFFLTIFCTVYSCTHTHFVFQIADSWEFIEQRNSNSSFITPRETLQRKLTSHLWKLSRNVEFCCESVSFWHHSEKKKYAAVVYQNCQNATFSELLQDISCGLHGTVFRAACIAT